MRIHRLARRKDDREVSVPLGIHVRTAGDEKLHHRNAIAVERGSHQRPIRALVHVRTVVDHPLRHRESRCAGRLPWNPALGDPGQRSVLAVAKWSTVQRRVSRYQAFDAREIVGIDGQLQLPDLVE
jgi:hypothetical protein